MHRGKADNLKAAAAALHAKEREQRKSAFPPMRGIDIFATHKPASLADRKFEVWPENWAAVVFFRQLGTRWIWSGSGVVTGLRWEAVYPLMDRMKLTEKEWQFLLQDLEALESGALAQMAKDIGQPAQHSEGLT